MRPGALIYETFRTVGERHSGVHAAPESKYTSEPKIVLTRTRQRSIYYERARVIIIERRRVIIIITRRRRRLWARRPSLIRARLFRVCFHYSVRPKRQWNGRGRGEPKERAADIPLVTPPDPGHVPYCRYVRHVRRAAPHARQRRRTFLYSFV